MSAKTAAERSWAGYHRCHGETRALNGTHVELSVGRFCTDNRATIFVDMQRDRVGLDFGLTRAPDYSGASSSSSEAKMIRAARSTAEHLPHQGLS